MRHLLYSRFGVAYCRERVRHVLHELGFRLRRLRHRHLKAQPEEQAAFRAELEELLAAWPEQWELIFVGGDRTAASDIDGPVVLGR